MSDLREAFRKIVAKESYRYTPLYERLARTIVDNDFLLGLFDSAPTAERVPTLVFAALHHCVLTFPDEPLARWYPTVTGGRVPDADPSEAVEKLVRRHADLIRTIARSRTTQTNEVGRSACLRLGIVEAARGVDAPLGIVEMGCSAGLNLRFDSYRCLYVGMGECGPESSTVRLECEIRGERRSPWPIPEVGVGSRIGIDRNPVDLEVRDTTQWLEACVFGDQPERLARLRGAIEIARARPVQMVRGNILETLQEVALAVSFSEHLLLMNSWVLFYFSNEERTELLRTIEAVSRTRPVSWLSAESPGSIPGLPEPPLPARGSPPTLLSLTTWGNGERHDRVLALMHPHGSWIEWLG